MKKIFSIFAALLFAGSMLAEQKSETLIFSTEAGYNAITVKTEGTSSTGSAFEFSQGDITVTGDKGYIKSKQFNVYSKSTMVVSAGGATIDSVKISYIKGCYPFKEAVPSGGNSTTQTSSAVTVKYVPETKVDAITFTNEAKGKTGLTSLTVYYTPAPTAPLTAITISIPEDVTIKKEYIVKESFDVTGIKAVATYEGVSEEEDVTKDVVWTLDPATFESVAENASVKVKASINAVISNELEITGITVRNMYTYTITWLDKNETIKTTTVTEGDALVLPATNPTCETKEFVGWTALETIPENATIEEMAFVNETTIPVADATYRAVFAKATKGESKSVELTQSSFGLETSYAVKTATIGEIGFTIDKGFKGSVNSNAVIQMNSKQGNGILYNTTAISGLESITLNVASGTNVTTIYQGTAQQPSTNEAGKTGETATISFAKGMTYFCLKVSGATYFSSIVINYTPIAYSEFSFTCPSTPSDIESISVPATSVQKTIENGQLIILRDGVKYNAMGVRLQ